MKKVLLLVLIIVFASCFIFKTVAMSIKISGAGTTWANLTCSQDFGPYNGHVNPYYNGDPIIGIFFNRGGTGSWEIWGYKNGITSGLVLLYTNSTTSTNPSATGWVVAGSGTAPAPTLCGPDVEGSPVCLSNQTITFGALSDKNYGDADYDPGATASSGLTVSYSSGNTAVATIVSNKIHIVGVGSATIYADQAGNASYNPAPQVSRSLTVNAKTLTVTGATVTSKTYDGATTATISGATLSGVIGADAVTLSNATTGTFTSASVGSGKSVSTSMTLTGLAADKYTLTQPTLSGTINAKTLTVASATATNKVYDGNTNAVISGATLVGKVGSDDVTLATATAGTFASANVGNAIVVTPAMSITGAAIGNYTLTQPTGINANITAKELTVTSATAENKVYDGNTDAIISGAILVGKVGSDDVTLATATAGTFANANVGNAIVVTPAMSITGAAIGNYTLTQPTGISANITARPIEITANMGQSKKFGEIDPIFTYTITNGSLVSGENLTGELSRVLGETIGSYAFQIGTLTAGNNYSITFISVNFIINALTQAKSLSDAKIKVYPIPAKENITIKSDKDITHIAVYNSKGQLVKWSSELSSNQIINISDLPSGFYVLKITIKEKVITKTFSKQ